MSFENMNPDENKEISNEMVVDADSLDPATVMRDARALAEVSSALETIKAGEPTSLESAKHEVMEKIAGVIHRSPALYESMSKDIGVLIDKIEKNEATPADVLNFAARLEPEDQRPFYDLAKVLEAELGLSGTAQ